MKKTKNHLKNKDIIIYKKLLKIKVSVSKSLQMMAKFQYSEEEKKDFKKKSIIYGIKQALFKDKGKNDLGKLEKEIISKELLEELAEKEETLHYYLKEILG